MAPKACAADAEPQWLRQNAAKQETRRGQIRDAWSRDYAVEPAATARDRCPYPREGQVWMPKVTEPQNPREEYSQIREGYQVAATFSPQRHVSYVMGRPIMVPYVLFWGVG